MPNSWIPPPAPSKHPTNEMGERFAESAGIYSATRAVALEDHRRMLRMHAKRLCEDHKIQQMAAGFRSKEDGFGCPEEEGEEMGDISVTGDQYHYQVPTTTTIEKQNVWAKIVPFLAVGAIITAMFLGYELSRLPKIQPVQPETNTDTVIGVSVE